MRFRRLKKLLWTSRERLLSLALVPAFLLGTLPHAACICSDGHRQENCPALACRSLSQETGATASSDCCCQVKSAHQARSCCAVKKHDAARVGSSVPAGTIAKGSTCCQRIVEAPAPASAVKHDQIAKRIAFDLVADVALPAIFSPQSRPALVRFDAPNTPLDLVIILQRLTI